jgi:hypothetical protein
LPQGVRNTGLDLTEGFLFGGLSPPNKKNPVLCVLGGSAVEILFSTRAVFGRVLPRGAIWDKEYYWPPRNSEARSQNPE